MKMQKFHLSLATILLVTEYCSSKQCVSFTPWNEGDCLYPTLTATSRCLQMKNQELQITVYRQARYFCGNVVPDERLFICGYNKTINHLVLIACPLHRVQMEPFIKYIKPSKISILGEGYNELSLAAVFHNVQSLREIKIDGVRTGGKFEVLFQLNYNVEEITIKDHDIVEFPSAPFKNLRGLKRLNIVDGALEVLNEDTLSNLKQLGILKVSNNNISKIDSLAFSDLTELRYLDLSHNNLNDISSNLFEVTAELSVLFLSDNRISKLPLHLFETLPKLRWLHFNGNKGVTVIPKQFFAGAKHLELFSVKNCSISDLEFSTESSVQKAIIYNKGHQRWKNITIAGTPGSPTEFVPEWKSTRIGTAISSPFCAKTKDSLRSLKKLLISYNKIHVIRSCTFEPLVGLQFLDASHNPLYMLPAISPFGPSESLRVILLAHCSLETMPNINLTKGTLSSIDLSYNNFTNLKLSVYSKGKPKIMLDNNRIRNIKLDFKRLGSGSPSYRLNNNDFVCDCQLEDFLRFLHSTLQASRRVISDAESLQCSFPNSSRKLIEVWPSYINCTIDECPEVCECYKTAEGIAVNCTNLGLLSIPDVIPRETNFLYLENNYISTFINVNHSSWEVLIKVNLSNNALKSVSSWTTIPPNLRNLDLSHNMLNDIPISLMEIVNSTPDFQISLSGNNWSCDCEGIRLVVWMKENKHHILDYKQLRCTANYSKLPIDYVTDDSFCPGAETSVLQSFKFAEIVLPIVGVLALLCLVVLCSYLYVKRYTILAFLYLHNMYKMEQVHREKLYDSFMLFHPRDYKKVSHVHHTLKSEYKFCILGKTEIPCAERSKNIIYGMENSRSTILFASQQFIESVLFQMNFYDAIKELSHRQRIIVIFLGSNDVRFLQRDLQRVLSCEHTLKWEEILFWEKLRLFLGNPSKMKLRTRRRRGRHHSKRRGFVNTRKKRRNVENQQFGQSS